MWTASLNPAVLQHPQIQIPYQSPPVTVQMNESSAWEFVDSIDPNSIRSSRDQRSIRTIANQMTRISSLPIEYPQRTQKAFQVVKAIFENTFRYNDKEQSIIREQRNEIKILKKQIDQLKSAPPQIVGCACPVCLKQFASMEYLDIHMQSKHAQLSYTWRLFRQNQPINTIEPVLPSHTAPQQQSNEQGVPQILEQFQKQIQENQKETEKQIKDHVLTIIREQMNPLETKLDELQSTIKSTDNLIQTMPINHIANLPDQESDVMSDIGPVPKKKIVPTKKKNQLRETMKPTSKPIATKITQKRVKNETQSSSFFFDENNSSDIAEYEGTTGSQMLSETYSSTETDDMQKRQSKKNETSSKRKPKRSNSVTNNRKKNRHHDFSEEDNHAKTRKKHHSPNYSDEYDYDAPRKSNRHHHDESSDDYRRHRDRHHKSRKTRRYSYSSDDDYEAPKRRFPEERPQRNRISSLQQSQPITIDLLHSDDEYQIPNSPQIKSAAKNRSPRALQMTSSNQRNFDFVQDGEVSINPTSKFRVTLLDATDIVSTNNEEIRKQEEEEKKRKAKEKRVEERRKKKEEDERRSLEAEQKRIEEERKRLEEAKRQVEERKQLEQERRKLEEQKKQEEERRKKEEEDRRKDEERKQIELEQKRLDEERKKLEIERKRQEEEKRQFEELKRKEIEKKKQEEKKILEEEKKKAEEQKRLEEERRNMEEQKKREDKKKKKEAEKKRIEQEKKKKQEEERLEQEQKRKEEQHRIEKERKQKEEEQKRLEKEKKQKEEEKRKQKEEEQKKIEKNEELKKQETEKKQDEQKPKPRPKKIIKKKRRNKTKVKDEDSQPNLSETESDASQQSEVHISSSSHHSKISKKSQKSTKDDEDQRLIDEVLYSSSAYKKIKKQRALSRTSSQSSAKSSSHPPVKIEIESSDDDSHNHRRVKSKEPSPVKPFDEDFSSSSKKRAKSKEPSPVQQYDSSFSSSKKKPSKPVPKPKQEVNDESYDDYNLSSSSQSKQNSQNELENESQSSELLFSSNSSRREKKPSIPEKLSIPNDTESNGFIMNSTNADEDQKLVNDTVSDDDGVRSENFEMPLSPIRPIAPEDQSSVSSIDLGEDIVKSPITKQDTVEEPEDEKSEEPEPKLEEPEPTLQEEEEEDIPESLDDFVMESPPPLNIQTTGKPIESAKEEIVSARQSEKSDTIPFIDSISSSNSSAQVSAAKIETIPLKISNQNDSASSGPPMESLPSAMIVIHDDDQKEEAPQNSISRIEDIESENENVESKETTRFELNNEEYEEIPVETLPEPTPDQNSKEEEPEPEPISKHVSKEENVEIEAQKNSSSHHEEIVDKESEIVEEEEEIEQMPVESPQKHVSESLEDVDMNIHSTEEELSKMKEVINTESEQEEITKNVSSQHEEKEEEPEAESVPEVVSDGEPEEIIQSQEDHIEKEKPKIESETLEDIEMNIQSSEHVNDSQLIEKHKEEEEDLEIEMKTSEHEEPTKEEVSNSESPEQISDEPEEIEPEKEEEPQQEATKEEAEVHETDDESDVFKVDNENPNVDSIQEEKTEEEQLQAEPSPEPEPTPEQAFHVEVSPSPVVSDIGDDIEIADTESNHEPVPFVSTSDLESEEHLPTTPTQPVHPMAAIPEEEPETKNIEKVVSVESFDNITVSSENLNKSDSYDSMNIEDNFASSETPLEQSPLPSPIKKNDNSFKPNKGETKQNEDKTPEPVEEKEPEHIKEQPSIDRPILQLSESAPDLEPEISTGHDDIPTNINHASSSIAFESVEDENIVNVQEEQLEITSSPSIRHISSDVDSNMILPDDMFEQTPPQEKPVTRISLSPTQTGKIMNSGEQNPTTIGFPKQMGIQPQANRSFNASPPPQGFGFNQQQQGGLGSPLPQAGQFNNQQGGFGIPLQQQGGFGIPIQQQNGFGTPLSQQNELGFGRNSFGQFNNDEDQRINSSQSNNQITRQGSDLQANILPSRTQATIGFGGKIQQLLPPMPDKPQRGGIPPSKPIDRMQLMEITNQLNLQKQNDGQGFQGIPKSSGFGQMPNDNMEFQGIPRSNQFGGGIPKSNQFNQQETIGFGISRSNGNIGLIPLEQPESNQGFGISRSNGSLGNMSLEIPESNQGFGIPKSPKFPIGELNTGFNDNGFSGGIPKSPKFGQAENGGFVGIPKSGGFGKPIGSDDSNNSFQGIPKSGGFGQPIPNEEGFQGIPKANQFGGGIPKSGGFGQPLPNDQNNPFGSPQRISLQEEQETGFNKRISINDQGFGGGLPKSPIPGSFNLPFQSNENSRKNPFSLSSDNAFNPIAESIESTPPTRIGIPKSQPIDQNQLRELTKQFHEPVPESPSPEIPEVQTPPPPQNANRPNKLQRSKPLGQNIVEENNENQNLPLDFAQAEPEQRHQSRKLQRSKPLGAALEPQEEVNLPLGSFNGNDNIPFVSKQPGSIPFISQQQARGAPLGMSRQDSPPFAEQNIPFVSQQQARGAPFGMPRQNSPPPFADQNIPFVSQQQARGTPLGMTRQETPPFSDQNIPFVSKQSNNIPFVSGSQNVGPLQPLDSQPFGQLKPPSPQGQGFGGFNQPMRGTPLSSTRKDNQMNDNIPLSQGHMGSFGMNAPTRGTPLGAIKTQQPMQGVPLAETNEFALNASFGPGIPQQSQQQQQMMERISRPPPPSDLPKPKSSFNIVHANGNQPRREPFGQIPTEAAGFQMGVIAEENSPQQQAQKSSGFNVQYGTQTPRRQFQ